MGHYFVMGCIQGMCMLFLSGVLNPRLYLFRPELQLLIPKLKWYHLQTASLAILDKLGLICFLFKMACLTYWALRLVHHEIRNTFDSLFLILSITIFTNFSYVDIISGLRNMR